MITGWPSLTYPHVGTSHQFAEANLGRGDVHLAPPSAESLGELGEIDQPDHDDDHRDQEDYHRDVHVDRCGCGLDHDPQDWSQDQSATECQVVEGVIDLPIHHHAGDEQDDRSDDREPLLPAWCESPPRELGENRNRHREESEDSDVVVPNCCPDRQPEDDGDARDGPSERDFR